MKSANQLWKESGTTLSFKEWITREKAKYSNFTDEEKKFILNKPLNENIESTLSYMDKKPNVQTQVRKGKTFGIPNYLIIGVGVIFAGVIAYQVYKYNKK
jgi:hypothetical protein